MKRTFAFILCVSMLFSVSVFASVVPAAGEDAVLYPVCFRDSKTGRIFASLNVAKGQTVPAGLVPAGGELTGYLFDGWFLNGNRSCPVETCPITAPATFVGCYHADESRQFTLTVRAPGYLKTFSRRFGAIATVYTAGERFSYWTLDGSYYSSARQARLCMPNRDATLEAVFDGPVELSSGTSFLSCFVDAAGALTATLSRDLLPGDTLLESGVLLTRKAAPADLVTDTPLSTVTRALSTASEEQTVFGFVRPGMFTKPGLWYVRGYLKYLDPGGEERTAYTVVRQIEVAGSGAAESEVFWMDASFMPGKGPDPYTPSTIVCEASALGSSARRPFFPTVTQASDGTLLCVYYDGDGHALYNQSEGKLSGVLRLMRSYDNGLSWTAPETIVDLTAEDPANGIPNREARDPNLQRLSDGTVVLSFPVRAPIGKAGYNNSSGNYNDYWAERSYYMTSLDNGATWSEMREIECDYFAHGEAFLYDDPTRTTGCWVKNGSMAELEGGDLLIPLYGASDCSSRGAWMGVVVKAHNNGDGTLSFYDAWANGSDVSILLPAGSGNETALIAFGDTVYALARTNIPSSTSGGVVYRSLDGGISFSEYALEPTGNDCLNQPNFCKVTDTLALVNYSVPLASVASSQNKRTARPVYGKLFDLSTGDWAEYDAVTIYDVRSATVADMGNPASVLLDDGRIFTVYYDTSAPATRYGFIGGTYTTLRDYVPASFGSGATLLDVDFSDLPGGAVYPTNGTAGDTINSYMSGGKLNRARDTDNGGTYGHAELRVSGTGDQYLEFYTNNQKRTACPVNKVLIAGDKGESVIVSFDYNFADNVTVDGDYHKIEVRLFDSQNALTRDISTLGVKVTPGAVSLMNGGTSLQSISLSASTDTWYTCKVLYQGGKAAFKVFARGEAEPDWSTAYAVNNETAAAAANGAPIGIACWARGTASTTAAPNSIYIDNVTATEAAMGFAGLYPSEGVRLHVGKSASVKVLMNSLVPLSGSQTLSAYCDNPAVAALDANGVVTALGVGKANIRVVSDGTEALFPVVVYR